MRRIKKEIYLINLLKGVSLINIIYNNQTIKFADENTQHQGLEELRFYIPFGSQTQFCILKGDAGIDICKMSKINENKKYEIFCLDLNNSINCKKVQSFALFSVEGAAAAFTNYLDCSLDTSTFDYITKIKVLKDLDSTLVDKYDKIVEMTKLNIEIFNSIKEVQG